MDQLRVSSDALSAFAVFAEHLNLTRAAEQLHLSQPSLHAKLASLARELGRPLYRKIGRRLVLTPEGETVARFARDHETHLARLLNELRVTTPSRPIVLAAGHVAYLHVIGDVVRSTLTERPGGLRLLHSNRDQMLTAIRTGQAHLGVAALDVLPDDLTVVTVAAYPQVLLVPDGHRLARRRTVKLADLAGEELVVSPPNRPSRITLERAMRAAGVPWRVGIEAEGWPLIVHFAAMGVGLAVVTGCVQPQAGLVARRITDLPGVTYHAIHRPGALDDPRVADLLAAIRAHAKVSRRATATTPARNDPTTETSERLPR